MTRTPKYGRQCSQRYTLCVHILRIHKMCICVCGVRVVRILCVFLRTPTDLQCSCFCAEVRFLTNIKPHGYLRPPTCNDTECQCQCSPVRTFLQNFFIEMGIGACVACIGARQVSMKWWHVQQNIGYDTAMFAMFGFCAFFCEQLLTCNVLCSVQKCVFWRTQTRTAKYGYLPAMMLSDSANVRPFGLFCKTFL